MMKASCKRWWGMGLALALSSCVAVNGAAYIKFDGVDGESAERPGWSDLADFSGSIWRPGYPPVPVMAGDVVVVKEYDKSSPKLAESAVLGTSLGNLVVEWQDTTAAVPYSLTMTLRDTRITEFSAAGAADGLDSIEMVTVSYTGADWDYRVSRAGGVQANSVSSFWNIEENTSGSKVQIGDNLAPVIQPIAPQTMVPGETLMVPLRISDDQTPADELLVTLSSSRPQVIDPSSVVIEGSGGQRTLRIGTSGAYSGTVVLTVTVSDGSSSSSLAFPVLIDVEMTPYEGFLLTYFSEEELRRTPFIAEPLADPDRDGLPNIIEYYLGTGPRQFTPASQALDFRSVPAPAGSSGIAYEIAYLARADDSRIQCIIWASPDLIDWKPMQRGSPLYSETAQTGENPLYEQRTGTITPPNDQPLFLSLQVIFSN